LQDLFNQIDVGLAIEFEFEVDGARPPLAIAYAWLLRVEAGVCGVCCAVDLLNNSGWLTVLFASKTEQYEQKTDQYGPHGLGNLLQLLFPRRKPTYAEVRTRSQIQCSGVAA
jgi:hypothetical protein